MPSIDFYFKVLAGGITLLFAALLAPRWRVRSGATLSIFLGLIALNHLAEAIRSLAADPLEQVIWFRVAAIAAALDPLALYLFARTVTPSVPESAGPPILFFGGSLALIAGWGLTVQPGLAPSTFIFPLILSVYTSVVYLAILRWFVRAPPVIVGQWRALVLALIMVAIPAIGRVVEELFAIATKTFLRGTLLGETYLTSLSLTLLGFAAVSVALRKSARASAGADGVKVLAMGVVIAIGLDGLGMLHDGVTVFSQLTQIQIVGPFIEIGRAENALRWLAFGALSSVAVFGQNPLAGSLTWRRLAVRTLIASVFLLLALAILIFGAKLFRLHAGTKEEIVVIVLAIALSSAFLALVDLAAQRWYAVPRPHDLAAAYALYQRAATEVLSRGVAPRVDSQLQNFRTGLGIDPAAAALLDDQADLRDATPLAPGRILVGRYRVERFVGRGGSGRVFLATDLLLRRSLILKEITFGTGESVLHEARASSSVKSPNVVTVYDVLPRGDGALLVTEYLSGGSLETRLESGPISGDEALRLLDGVMAGIGAVHARGIVHGDVKPANILLTDEGMPKVADFGVAMHEGAKTLMIGPASASAAGTPGWMAPEQMRGERATMASDVYAVGLLTQRFFGDDSPAWLCSIVEKALNDEPSQRWPNVCAMLAAFRAARDRQDR